MRKKNKGITLIALIITIIIMLILVAVSIQIAVQSGLFKAAGKAAQGTNMAKDAEAELASGKVNIGGTIYDSIDEYLQITEKGSVTQVISKDKANNTKLNSNNVKEVVQTKTATTTYEAPIPVGFTVSGIESEQSIVDGLVIYDIPEGADVDWTDPDSVRTTYNQFVWIPVKVKATDTETSVANFYRSEWKDNARSTSLMASTTYTEPYTYDGPYGTDADTGIAQQLIELTASVYKYGGFYIGRYEAGSETARTSSSGKTEVGVKQDMYPYNYVSWGDAMCIAGETGAVALSNELYTGKEGYNVKSMLCTGACWDSMLDFVKDDEHNVNSSANWGNCYNSETYSVKRGSLYDVITSTWTPADAINGSEVTQNSSILLTTGATDRNSAKNIYDVAGNCKEWTTEAEGGKRGFRYVRGWLSAACSRSGYYPDQKGDGSSFRPILYLQ